MSDSDDDQGDRVRSSTATTMRSIFATDKRSAQPPAKAAAPPNPGQAQSAAAATAAVVAFKGENRIGSCAAVVVVAQGAPSAHIALVNQERRTLARVKVDDALQLLLNSQERVYATLYDPTLQLHWTLMFKSAGDATAFVAAATTVQHYLLIADGPRPPYQELIRGSNNATTDPRLRVAKGDKVSVAATTWLVQRVAQCYSCGKNVEDIPPDAPRSIRVGEGVLMTGTEEVAVGMTEGDVRIAFLPPRKTQITVGLGNPEVGPNDSVVVVIQLVKLAAKASLPSLGDVGAGTAIATIKPAAEPPVQPVAVAPPAAAVAPQPAPAAPTSTGLSTELLLQTVLALQLQQQTLPAPPPAPVPAAPHVEKEYLISPVVERSLDRIDQQLRHLFEKVDRLDLDKKIEANNEKIERMVKKAVGKAPIADIDIEDMTKDRDQLLAKIESQKVRIEELTNSYHQALEVLGRHKDEVAGLKSDLVVERETSNDRHRELTERHRLTVVELEVRHRSSLDKVRDAGFEDGKAKGYQDGYAAGKIDAMSQFASDGRSGADSVRELLTKKETELVELQRQITQAEGRLYEERRQAADQVQSLQGLIERLEKRESVRGAAPATQAESFVRILKRAMNSTYSLIEQQLYATEKQSLDVQDCLTYVLETVRSETRTAAEDMRREAALMKHQADPLSASDSAQPTPRPMPPAMPSAATVAVPNQRDRAPPGDSRPTIPPLTFEERQSEIARVLAAIPPLTHSEPTEGPPAMDFGMPPPDAFSSDARSYRDADAYEPFPRYDASPRTDVATDGDEPARSAAGARPWQTPYDDHDDN